jgi:hypothetical protein
LGQAQLQQPDHPLCLPIVVLAASWHQPPGGTFLAAQLVYFGPIPCGQLLGGSHQLVSLI